MRQDRDRGHGVFERIFGVTHVFAVILNGTGIERPTPFGEYQLEERLILRDRAIDKEHLRPADRDRSWRKEAGNRRGSHQRIGHLGGGWEPVPLAGAPVRSA